MPCGGITDGSKQFLIWWVLMVLTIIGLIHQIQMAVFITL